MKQLCACGCGEPLDDIKHPYYRRYRKGYKPGHAARLNPRRPSVPPADQIPSGICECGCGKPTAIATHTVAKRRVFKGHPTPYCRGHSRRTSGPEHHLFKGIRGTGLYVLEYAPDHPAAYSGHEAGYVAQHRLVWERANGRMLRPNEVVHHINGNRHDNRPENLAALTQSGHCSLHSDDHRQTDPEVRRKISESMKRVWAQRRAAQS